MLVLSYLASLSLLSLPPLFPLSLLDLLGEKSEANHPPELFVLSTLLLDGGPFKPSTLSPSLLALLSSKVAATSGGAEEGGLQ